MAIAAASAQERNANDFVLIKGDIFTQAIDKHR
jgi:hypothetical protein